MLRIVLAASLLSLTVVTSQAEGGSGSGLDFGSSSSDYQVAAQTNQILPPQILDEPTPPKDLSPAAVCQDNFGEKYEHPQQPGGSFACANGISVQYLRKWVVPRKVVSLNPVVHEDQEPYLNRVWRRYWEHDRAEAVRLHEQDPENHPPLEPDYPHPPFARWAELACEAHGGVWWTREPWKIGCNDELLIKVGCGRPTWECRNTSDCACIARIRAALGLNVITLEIPAPEDFGESTESSSE